VQKRRSQGFTLVEISIVLVILALLVGGILISSEATLGRANVSSLISKVGDLSAASRSFKSRFGYYPGDIPNAQTTVSAGISGGCNYAASTSVGNGLVDTATESTCALEHLVQSQLLSKIEFDTAFFISSGFKGGRVSLWFNSATNQNSVRVTSIPCDIALEIDRKLDNGAAATPLSQGTVLAFDTAGAALASCVTGTTVASLIVGY
jgi:prepilin-type N-terminal cleavage/methylation domain-containing protein